MKIAILAAGKSNYFPLFIDKPKCMYHLNGKIQLERVIEDAKTIVDEKDIIVVAGYKYNYIENFLKKYPDIVLKINEKYNDPAIWSFRKAIEDEDDDIVFMFADESISLQNIRRIAQSKRKMAILTHNKYWYYSLGIFKLRKDQLYLIADDRYLSFDYIKSIFEFANKRKYDYSFNIKSGICIGYMIIDFVRRLGNIREIEDPRYNYEDEDIDFLYYNPKEEYVPDLDHIKDTDEYKNSIYLRLYTICISDLLKLPVRILLKVRRICVRLFQ
jgi:hypothetical protein